jgi:hypothetical protein
MARMDPKPRTRWQASTLLSLLLFVCAQGLAAPPRATPEAELPFPVLSKAGEPLRTQFNQKAGSVRLVLLLDPT